MFSRIFILVIVLLFGGLVAAYFLADPGARQRPTVTRVSDLFDRLAFSGFGDQGPQGQGPVLRRWEEPVKIAVMAPEHERIAGYLTNFATVFSGIQGLDVEVVADAPYTSDPAAQQAVMGQGNLHVVSVPPGDLEAFIDTGAFTPKVKGELANGKIACLTVGVDRGRLDSAMVFVRDGLDAGKLHRCLAQEVSFALGVHIDDSTFFATFQGREEGSGLQFSPVGRLAVALIYDRDLLPGMARAEGLEVARDKLRARGLPETDETTGEKP